MTLSQRSPFFHLCEEGTAATRSGTLRSSGEAPDHLSGPGSRSILRAGFALAKLSPELSSIP